MGFDGPWSTQPKHLEHLPLHFVYPRSLSIYIGTKNNNIKIVGIDAKSTPPTVTPLTPLTNGHAAIAPPTTSTPPEHLTKLEQTT